MKKYTPEERKQYPSHIWVIERKTKKDLFIDAQSVKGLVQDLNSNDFIWSELHNTTIHKFEIVDIYIKKVDDKCRFMIQSFFMQKNKEIESKKNISLQQTFQFLKKSIKNPSIK